MPTGTPNAALILVGGGASASVTPIPTVTAGTLIPLDIEFSGEASPTTRLPALSVDPGDIDPLSIEMEILTHQLLSGAPISLESVITFTTSNRLTRESIPKDLGVLSGSIVFGGFMEPFSGPASLMDPEIVTFAVDTEADLAPDPNSFGAWEEDESGKAKMRIKASAMLSLLVTPADEPPEFTHVRRRSHIMSDFVLNERGHPE